MDMQLVEYTFARWVYIDKCDDFVDLFDNPSPDMKVVIDTLGSDTACVRALILYGHLANGGKTRHSRSLSTTCGKKTPLEAFKEALRIGLAAAEDPTSTVVDIVTRPWERTSQSIYWLPITPPDLPIFIPRPLSSLTWNTVNPSGTATVSGTDLIRAPRELSTSHVNSAEFAGGDLSAVWSCNEAQVVYRNGECTVYPRLPGMKPFVVTGLPAAHPRFLQHCKPDRDAGPLHTTARQASSRDVKDAPMLLIWSCVHGDLFVQAPNQVPVLPPISSFDFVHSSNPSSSFFNTPQSSPTSSGRHAPVSPHHDRRPPPPALHPSLAPAPRSQPVFFSGRPHPRQRQSPTLSPSDPYPTPGMLPPNSQRSVQRVKACGPAHPKTASLAVFTPRQTAQGQHLPQAALRSSPPSLSVFQSRTPATPNTVPPSSKPRTPVSEKKSRDSGPTPGPSSRPAPGPSTHAHTTSSTPTPVEPTPPVPDETTVCGFDDCATLLTPSSWEEHFDLAHGISEKTWITDSLCSHPACCEAQIQAVAKGTPPSKLTIGVWATYKRHIKQVHFPNGRTHPCTFPGCDAVLSRADALRRHVESKHKVVLAGRERAAKRTSTEGGARSEEGPAKKKPRASTSLKKQRTPRMKESGKKASGGCEKASSVLTPPVSRKGKEVVRGGSAKENRDPSSTSASLAAGPSRMEVDDDDEDVDMVDDEDENMVESEDEFDDEWPQGDIIEDEMNFDPDNY